jgi:hypothetical protein
MRMTVIVPDRIVQIDGIAFETALPPHAPALHAIQFQPDGSCEIEYRNERLVSEEAAAFIAPFVKAWEAAKAARDYAASEEAAQAAATAARVG